jgi:hypothetical protein
MDRACPSCACTTPHPAHAVLAALGDDDLDAALQRGLLEVDACRQCSDGCRARLAAARHDRADALAARERYRARAARLARRKAERDAARVAPTTSTAKAPTLPASAADVLARALAKAATRKP